VRCWRSARLPFPRPTLGGEVFGACGGEGGPDWYEVKQQDYEMPPEGIRVLLAEAMHWTLDYADSLELKERLETFTVLNARTEAQNSRLRKD